MQKFTCIFECEFYRRNDLELLDPWIKNIKNYCGEGFFILLDPFCVIQVGSSGSEFSGQKTEAFSCIG